MATRSCPVFLKSLNTRINSAGSISYSEELGLAFSTGINREPKSGDLEPATSPHPSRGQHFLACSMSSSRRPGASLRFIVDFLRLLRTTKRVNRDRLSHAPDRYASFRVEAQARIRFYRPVNGFGNHDGEGFGLTAQARGQIDRISDSRIIEMLRRADVSNDGSSGMDTDSQAEILHTIHIS